MDLLFLALFSIFLGIKKSWTYLKDLETRAENPLLAILWFLFRWVFFIGVVIVWGGLIVYSKEMSYEIFLPFILVGVFLLIFFSAIGHAFTD